MARKSQKASSPSMGIVLVVGTTPDYIARLHERHPDSLIFVTAVHFKGNPLLKGIPTSAILYSNLEDVPGTLGEVEDFLSSRKIEPSGVACFDCESLVLSSRVAAMFHRPFPPWEATTRARNKFDAKIVWEKAGISCPGAMLASTLDQTLDFFLAHGRDIVIKPLSGSGSELLFHCTREKEVEEAIGIISRELPRRRSNPLFRPLADPITGKALDPCSLWVLEEFVAGEEFSLDFVLQSGRVTIIRETGKVKAQDKPFGSVLAYLLPPSYPPHLKREALPELLKRAVTSLGFDWGFFMVDFIVRDGVPCLLEVTPRPGGDSIPDLVKIAYGRDIIDIYLGFVRGLFKGIEGFPSCEGTYASINLYAPREGTILNLAPARLLSESHVMALHLKKKKGERLLLPPGDYDNRLVAHCVIRVERELDFHSESERLMHLLDLSIA